MNLPELKYNEAGLIPCIVQDADTGAVLMMAWMSAESLALTLERGETVFFSRSRQPGFVDETLLESSDIAPITNFAIFPNTSGKIGGNFNILPSPS